MTPMLKYPFSTALGRVLTTVGATCAVAGAALSLMGGEHALSVMFLAVGIGLFLLASLWGLHVWTRRQMSFLRRKIHQAETMIGGIDEMRQADTLELQAKATLRDEAGKALEAQVIAGRAARVADKAEIATTRAELHESREKVAFLQRDMSQNLMASKKVEEQLRAGLSGLELLGNKRHAQYLGKFLLLSSGNGSTQVLLNEDEVQISGLHVMQDHPLVAYPALRDSGRLDVIPRGSQRRLATALRGLGYWQASLDLLSGVLDDNSPKKDLLTLSLRRDEYRLFSGGYEPVVELGPVNYQPMQGHILHVVGKSLPKTQSGYTIRTHYTAMAQQRAGFHVSVVCQVGENDTPDEERLDYVDDIAYYCLTGADRLSRPFTDWLNDNIAELDRLVRRIRPALLHAHADFFNAVIAQVVGRKYGIPVVYESRGFWEESWLSRTAQRHGISDWETVAERNGMPDAYLLRRSMEEKARSESDHVFTLARVMEDHIVRAGLDPAKVSLVPNAVDPADFPVVDRDITLAREHGISDDETVIGYVSSIVEYEGIDILLEAYRQAAARTSMKLKLLIVGDGPVLDELKAQRDRDQIQDVLFTGRVPHEQVLGYYSLIDVFCVPRRPADVCRLVTPLKPFEAFSSGRAVVLSDVEALREIAEDSGAARLFQAGVPESLADTLVELVEDASARVEMARLGAEWVRRERSWDNNAETYVKAYSDLDVRPFSASDIVTEFASEVDYTVLADWTRDNVSSDYTRWFYSQTKFSADDICGTGWIYADFPTVDLSTPVDWDEVCRSNRTWAFNLHTWEFMDPVVRAYSATGDPEQLEWVLQRAIDWIEYYVEQDRVREGSMAWYDMGLGLRSPRLTALISLALKADVGTEVLRKLIAGAMRHQYEHSLDKSFNPRTNHGYYAAVGQTVLGRGLRQLPGMAALAEQGIKRIRFMADSQFKDDGVHSEHSPDYHRMLLDSFKLGIEQGLIDDDAVISRIEKAGYALGWMIKPDGQLLQFGDSPARDMIMNVPNYSSSAETNFLVNKGRAGSPNDKVMEVFPVSGYAFVRSPQPHTTSDHETASYLAFSAAFHSRAHKHADDLNLVWSDKGQEILVDGGRFGYGQLLSADSPLRAFGFYYDSAERQYVESTIAHNTVAVDGLNHDRRKRRPFGSGMDACIELDGQYILTGHVDHGFWQHSRQLSFLPGQWLIVEDRLDVTDGQPHDFRSWFNLAGDFDLEVCEGSVLRVDHANWDESLWIQSFSNSDLILPVKGETEPMRGWRSIKDREMIQSWSLGYATYQDFGDVICTAMNFGPEPLDHDPRAE